MTNVALRDTDYVYDNYGRLVEVWRPTEQSGSNPSVEFDYDPSARPAWVETNVLQKDSNAQYLTSREYVDGFGRTTQSQAEVHGGGRAVSGRYYDARGLVRREAVPWYVSTSSFSFVEPDWTGVDMSMDQATVYTFDALGRVTLTETIAKSQSGGVIWNEEVAYDKWDQTVTNRLEVDTDYAYDAFGNLIEVVEHNDTATYTTDYQYDLANRLVTVDGNASGITDKTTIEYDLLGRKTEMTDPDMGTWKYEYDGVGRLVLQRDGRTKWVKFNYDNLGRPIEKWKSTWLGAENRLLAEWDYDTDRVGALAKATSYEYVTDDSVVDWTIEVDPLSYDDRGRVTATEWTINTSTSFRFDWTYDEADHVKTIEYPTVGGAREKVTYSYDFRSGLPTGLTSNTGDDIVDSATWNAIGQPTEQVWGETGTANQELTVTWEYKSDSLRLFKTKAGTGGTGSSNKVSTVWWYDEAGNVTQTLDWKNSAQVQCYDYDDLDRLVAAFTSDNDSGSDDCSDGYTATGTGPYSRSWEYSSIGNILSWTDEVSSTGHDYDYQGGGPHQVTDYNGTSYTYDANGNQTDRGPDDLHFDHANRLTQYDSNANGVSEFGYDADDVRIVREDPDGTITYAIAGLFEYQDTMSGPDEWRSYYTFGGETIGLRVYQSSSSDERYWLVPNLVGSNTTQVRYSNGARTQQYYYPYGEIRPSTGTNSLVTTHTYTGQIDDAETGLMFYDARYYDTISGRFISADPVIPDVRNPRDLNRYTYVRNNPIRHNDPDGHETCEVVDGKITNVCYSDYELYAAQEALASGQQAVDDYTDWKADQGLCPQCSDDMLNALYEWNQAWQARINGMTTEPPTANPEGSAARAVANIVKNVIVGAGGVAAAGWWCAAGTVGCPILVGGLAGAFLNAGGEYGLDCHLDGECGLPTWSEFGGDVAEGVFIGSTSALMGVHGAYYFGYDPVSAGSKARATIGMLQIYSDGGAVRTIEFVLVQWPVRAARAGILTLAE